MYRYSIITPACFGAVAPSSGGRCHFYLKKTTFIIKGLCITQTCLIASELFSSIGVSALNNLFDCV
jgi:hypothetical protein